MAIEFSGFPIILTPTLIDTGYAVGDVLFAPEQISNLNHRGSVMSTLKQLGIFWNIANAPEISVFFFHREPTGWGTPGDPPTPTFDDRAALIGQWNVDASQGQGYEELNGDNNLANSYALVTGGALAIFNSDDQVGYVAATAREAATGTLNGQLKLTFIVDK